MSVDPDALAYRLDGGDARSTPITEGCVLIGRGEKCGIRIDDLAVSRVHAKLELRDDAWSIQDTGSRNGTRLNDLGVPPSRKVRCGDTIQLVGDVEHRIEIVSLPLPAQAHARIDAPTGARASLKSFSVDCAANLAHIVTSEDERIEHPIRPAYVTPLLAALLEARATGRPLGRDEERAEAQMKNDKNGADVRRARLRVWWRDLCALHPALDRASPRASARNRPDEPEIMLRVGDEWRLAISVATCTVERDHRKLTASK